MATKRNQSYEPQSKLRKLFSQQAAGNLIPHPLVRRSGTRRRIKRVNQLMREELANILLKEIELPQGTMATISRVETMADLKSARVWLSIIPFGRSQEILQIFKKNISRIQFALGKQVKFRFTPKIKFFNDHLEDKAGQIIQLLDEIKNE